MKIFSLFSNLSSAFMIELIVVAHTVLQNAFHFVFICGISLAAWA